MRSLEAVALEAGWDSPSRVRRIREGTENWWLSVRGGVRRSSGSTKEWKWWWWNPWVVVRVLGLWCGAGIAFSEPAVEGAAKSEPPPDA